MPRPICRKRSKPPGDKVFPALVHVQPISEVFERGKKTKQTAVGSGVIIDKEGYVITNYHVAGKAVKALCTLENKERIEGELVGGDPLTDLAVLKLDLSQYKGQLKWAELGDSSKLETGDYVLAMGSPLSLSRSLSEGIVSCPGGGPRLNPREFRPARSRSFLRPG